jgi:hypothetical protein
MDVEKIKQIAVVVEKSKQKQFVKRKYFPNINNNLL